MFKNYIKIAWRNLKRNKIFSFINIFGLAIGLWACMTVATVIIDDLSYDRQWNNKNELYRIISHSSLESHAGANKGFITSLPENFPEIKKVAKIKQIDFDLKFKRATQDYIYINALETDTSIWELLDFEVLQGNPRAFQHGQDNMVISERFRDTYFAGQNPVGKTVYRVYNDDDEPTPYLITGVIKNTPSNTHLRTDVIVLDEPTTRLLTKEDGAGGYYPIYVLLEVNTDVPQFTKKVNQWFEEFMERDIYTSFEFQPIKDVYLHSNFEGENGQRGDMDTIYILSGVALMLLVIACVNYINLSVARSLYRLKEIGTRKVLGAKNRNIAGQFLTESLLFFFISTVLATVIYSISLPYLNTYLGHDLEITFMSRPILFAIVVSCILLVSLLVGWYPSVMMSRFRPIQALKGSLPLGTWAGHGILQKGLVVLQFTITLVVLISLLVVGDQWTYLKNRDIGYNKEGLLAIPYTSWDGKGQAFKKDVLALSGVESAAHTKWIPTKSIGNIRSTIKDPENPSNHLRLVLIEGDLDFPRTLGLHLKDGRLFDPSFPSDYRDYMTSLFEDDDLKPKPSALLTDYTRKQLLIDELNISNNKTHTTPVGVVNDFNIESLKNPSSLTVILAKDSIPHGSMLIRVIPGLEQTVARKVNKLFSEYYPNKIMDIAVVNNLLVEQYAKEAKLWQFFLFFSLLVLFLSALGVFGLVEQATAQRIKEVGIRKVLGASITSVVYLFIKSFLRLLILAGVIGIPIAWYGGFRWLQNYAYRIDVEWQQLILAASLVTFITLATVLWQTVKAALANPIKSLRTE